MSKKHSSSEVAPNPTGWPLIQSFQTDLNRVFDAFNARFQPMSQRMLPVLDIAETEDAVEITAEMPGVKPEDLDVSISGDMVILKGHKSDAREDRTKDWHHVERSFGSFRRHVPLGFAPKDAAVDARFADGVLTLRIAKPAEIVTASRKIEISQA